MPCMFFSQVVFPLTNRLTIQIHWSKQRCCSVTIFLSSEILHWLQKKIRFGVLKTMVDPPHPQLNVATWKWNPSENKCWFSKDAKLLFACNWCCWNDLTWTMMMGKPFELETNWSHSLENLTSKPSKFQRVKSTKSDNQVNL